MSYRAYFFDGPCRGKIQTEGLDFDPKHWLVCGGSTYVYSPDAGGPSGPSAVGLKVYVVKGGKNDGKNPTVAGETDVFKAWGDLHHSLNRGVGRQVKRVRDSRQRIKRAVR